MFYWKTGGGFYDYILLLFTSPNKDCIYWRPLSLEHSLSCCEKKDDGKNKGIRTERESQVKIVDCNEVSRGM